MSGFPTPLIEKQTASCVGDGAVQDVDGAKGDTEVRARVDGAVLLAVIRLVVLALPTRVALPELVVILLIPIAAKATENVKLNIATNDRTTIHFRRIEILAFV